MINKIKLIIISFFMIQSLCTSYGCDDKILDINAGAIGKIRVEVWSDIICPMCPIGEVRLKRALEEFPQRDQVEMVHRSYRLMPEVKAHSVDEDIARKFGGTHLIKSVQANTAKLFEADGLIYDPENMLSGDTLDVHQLIHFARTQGLEQQLIDRVYKGYYSEHANLFNRNSLLQLATEAGLDRTAAAFVLDSNQYKAEVEADQRAALEAGAKGVPFIMINNDIVLKGGQGSIEILAALKKAYTKTGKSTSEGSSHMPGCSSDGCEIRK